MHQGGTQVAAAIGGATMPRAAPPYSGLCGRQAPGLRLAVMDATALVLANEYGSPTRRPRHRGRRQAPQPD